MPRRRASFVRRQNICLWAHNDLYLLYVPPLRRV